MKFYLVHSVGNRMRFRTDSVMSNATARLILLRWVPLTVLRA